MVRRFNFRARGMLTGSGFDEALTESVSRPHGRGTDRADAICNLPSARLNGKASWLLLYHAPGADRTGEGEHNAFAELLRHA
jgi:hypothetical protein